MNTRSAAAETAFRARLVDLGAELLEAEYLGSKRPHRVRCASGHECWPLPQQLTAGAGICRRCQHRSDEHALRFRARLVDLGAELLEAEYLGSHRPHRAKCASGHECWPIPEKVLRRGYGPCFECGPTGPDARRAAEARFRARLSELGAELLEPSWLGANRPHRVRCAAGHESSPRPQNVERWGVCRACQSVDPVEGEARFRARLSELGAEMLEPSWLGWSVPHRVRCSAGHVGRPRPHAVVGQGQGVCRFCRGLVWDRFYVVRSVVLRRVKFGVTSGDPRPRLARHRSAGYVEVVRLLEVEHAIELERVCLSTLRDAGWSAVAGREYFDASTLGLLLDVVDGWSGAKTYRGGDLLVSGAG